MDLLQLPAGGAHPLNCFCVHLLGGGSQEVVRGDAIGLCSYGVLAVKIRERIWGVGFNVNVYTVGCTKGVG